MKHLIFFFLLSFKLVQAYQVPEDFREDYGPGYEEELSVSEILNFKPLYELLFSAPIRNQFPSESYKSFQVHLKDSFQYFPSPFKINQSQLRPIKGLSGSITYVGIVKKKYSHDIIEDQFGEKILKVRVHFKNANPQDLRVFREKFKQAEDIWNQSRVDRDFKYRFVFEVVEKEVQSHFSVFLLDETRGPYDSFWSRRWTSRVVAHELGHMLGLGDEYKTISGKIDCYKTSLMCSSWSGVPLPHHYYFILRRLIKLSNHP
jgi:hypothetical protein